MKISVCGAGFVGLPLARGLKLLGHQVQVSTTTPEKALKLQNDFQVTMIKSPEIPPPHFLNCDLLILNIPPKEHHPDWYKQWDLKNVGMILYLGSTSIYRDGIHSETLRGEEHWVKNTGLPYVICRAGGLVGNGRHPGKSLSGKKDVKGQNHPVNLIHVDDVRGFLLTVLEKNIQNEIFDLVSDEHHTKKEFYTEYCRKNALPLPEFDPNDQSTALAHSNASMKCYYKLKFPTMFGKSL